LFYPARCSVRNSVFSLIIGWGELAKQFRMKLCYLQYKQFQLVAFGKLRWAVFWGHCQNLFSDTNVSPPEKLSRMPHIRLNAHWRKYKSGYPCEGYSKHHEFACIPMVADHVNTNSVWVQFALIRGLVFMQLVPLSIIRGIGTRGDRGDMFPPLTVKGVQAIYLYPLSTARVS